MNDLKDLLELALSDGHAPVPGQRGDPAADLARGRRLLRRRRRRRLASLAAATAAVLCGGLVPLSLHDSGPAAVGHQAVATATSSRPGPTRAPSGTVGQIKLVAWVGTQPPGYRVSWMPKGLGGPGQHPLRAGHGATRCRGQEP